MAGFLFFLEGEPRQINLTHLAELGVGHLFDASCQCRTMPTSHTPTGRPGSLFAQQDKHAEGFVIDYDPDAQHWLCDEQGDPMPLPGTNVYIGLLVADPPTSADLLRKKTLPGTPIELLAGGEWIVPTVRRFDALTAGWQSALPCYVGMDRTGRPTRGRTLQQYAHLWDVTEPICAAMLAMRTGEGSGPTDQEFTDAAVTLLQANYLVDLATLVLLDALDVTTVSVAVMVATRWWEFAQWVSDNEAEKKNPDSAVPGLTTAVGEAV